MTIKAVYFDFGGVIGRTMDPAPRQRQAERLGISVKELGQAVFDGESSRLASVGKISEETHRENVMHALGLPVEGAQAFADEFFSGDVIDLNLIDYLRKLRPGHRTGLISNAWSGLRPWMTGKGITDAFDEMIISAEVGMMKPDPGIYRLALDRLKVMPAEAVFVDDFIENVEGARAVGMYAVHFTGVETALSELKDLLSDHR